MLIPDEPSPAGHRTTRVATVASWVVPIIVTTLNVLLVVGVSAGPRTALLVLVLALFGGASFMVGRLLSHARHQVTEPDASAAPFDEDLNLKLWIGRTADGDRVLERRSTRSARAVGQRALTLISPFAASGAEAAPVVPRLKVLDPSCEASWTPLDVAGRGIVRFKPAMVRKELRWEIAYSVTGLWNPLRTLGIDIFRYDVRAFDIGAFAVRFIFDSSAVAVSVQERNRRGVVGDAEIDANGNWSVLWQADNPTTAARYEFGLRVDWGHRAEVKGSTFSGRAS